MWEGIQIIYNSAEYKNLCGSLLPTVLILQFLMKAIPFPDGIRRRIIPIAIIYLIVSNIGLNTLLGNSVDISKNVKVNIGNQQGR